MLLSGAFLLALVLLGVIVAVTGDRGAVDIMRRRRRRPLASRAAAAADTASSSCSLPAGQQAIPAEQPAAGAVGDGRLDAGPAEPGRVRAAALERTVEHVLCA